MPSPPRTPIPPLRILVSDLGRTRVIGPSYHDDPAGAVGAMTDNALTPPDTSASDAPDTPDTSRTHIPENPENPATRQTPGTTGTASTDTGAATILTSDPVATFPCDASPEEISAALREVQLTPAGSVEDAPAARRERLQQLCAWLAAALHTPTRPQQRSDAEPT